MQLKFGLMRSDTKASFLVRVVEFIFGFCGITGSVIMIVYAVLAVLGLSKIPTPLAIVGAVAAFVVLPRCGDYVSYAMDGHYHFVQEKEDSQ